MEITILILIGVIILLGLAAHATISKKEVEEAVATSIDKVAESVVEKVAPDATKPPAP